MSNYDKQIYDTGDGDGCLVIFILFLVFLWLA
jgi:hypothetical protein